MYKHQLVPVGLLPTPSTPLRAAAKLGRHFRKVRERMGHPPVAMVLAENET